MENRRSPTRARSRRQLTTEPPDIEPTPAEAITAYAALVAAEVADKRASKESLERRGLQVVTTSGALLTIIFGLVSLVARDGGFAIPLDARPFLYLSLLAFTCATLFGLAANYPLEYLEVTPDGLRKTISGSNVNSEYFGQVTVAKTQVRTLESYWRKNKWKARLVAFGIGAEFVAIGSLAAVVAYLVAAA